MDAVVLPTPNALAVVAKFDPVNTNVSRYAVADDIKDYGKDHEKVYSNPEEIDRLLAVQKDFKEICDAKVDELRRVGAEENYMMERFEDFYKMLRKHAEREASLNKDSIDSVPQKYY